MPTSAAGSGCRGLRWLDTAVCSGRGKRVRDGAGVGRHQFSTVRIVDGRAEPAFKASGDITSMAHADGYIEIASEVAAIEAGAMVDVVLF